MTTILPLETFTSRSNLPKPTFEGKLRKKETQDYARSVKQLRSYVIIYL